MEKIKDFQDVETRVDTGANEKIQSAGAQAGNGANQVKTGTDKPSGSLKHAASVAGGAVAGAAGAAVIMGFVVPEDAPEPVPETPDGINSAPGILPDAADFNGSQVPVAGSVNDDMSFSEAFGAARNETGPGGIFLWKGGVYGTYYRDEWSQLSPEYKQTFSDYPYHQPEASHTADINSADEPAIAATASEDDQPDEQQTAEATDDAATAEELQTAEVTGDATTAEELQTAEVTDDAATAEELQTAEVTDDAATAEEPQTAEVTDDAATAEDVEVLGIQYTEIDGQMVAVAPISVDGREGLLIDVDADGIFDYTVSDNGTGNPDMEDISGDRITYNDVTGFQETPHSAANTEAYPIADEQIPDYTNNVPIDDYTV